MRDVTCQAIQDSGFKLTATPQEIEDLILNDFLNNDVPYFAISEGKMYYGCSNDGKQIGEKI